MNCLQWNKSRWVDHVPKGGSAKGQLDHMNCIVWEKASVVRNLYQGKVSDRSESPPTVIA